MFQFDDNPILLCMVILVMVTLISFQGQIVIEVKYE